MSEFQEWKKLGKRVFSLGREVISKYLDEAEKTLLEKKPSMEKAYTCKVCSEVFINRYKFAAHRKKHKGEERNA